MMCMLAARNLILLERSTPEEFHPKPSAVNYGIAPFVGVAWSCTKKRNTFVE